MNYEQKYKEALERARMWRDKSGMPTDRQGILDDIFPQLKESEDEKIRKALIEYFNEQCDMSDWNGVYGYQVVAWLEKQGEQKPVDNVGSKFKVEEGKWYVCTQTFVLRGKIVIIKGQTYQAEKDNVIKGENGCRFIDRHDGKASDYFRSWTIQDAKDGDVLAEDTCTFIIKKLNHDLTAETYCCLYDDDDFELNSNLGFDDTCTYPATKEQRDLLFQKIKEEEYEWDAERKELKKINKNTDVGHEYFSDLLEKDDCDNIDDYAYQCAYCMSHDWMKDTATWDDVERACKLGAEWNERHHNSSWSEEDAVNFNLVYTYVPDDSLRDWLKELKERYTWKPSDTQIRALEYIINNAHNTSYSCKIAKELLEQLRKLKGEEV